MTQKYDKLADMLLEEGADPNVQDADGRTALMHTCQDGSPELTRLLLSFQADTQLKDVKGTEYDIDMPLFLHFFVSLCWDSRGYFFKVGKL